MKKIARSTQTADKAQWSAGATLAMGAAADYFVNAQDFSREGLALALLAAGAQFGVTWLKKNHPK